MNYPEFMTAVIEIYGQYQSETLKKLTAVYIKERWDEKELESIFKQLLLKKPSRYKTPPDPAEFEEIFPKKSLESDALFWFDKLSKEGVYYSYEAFDVIGEHSHKTNTIVFT